MPISSVQHVADKSFDYIICGGGTAGLTLAARLSEDPSVSVLVLEAGEANLHDPAILRPASYGSHFSNASYFHPYQTTQTGGVQHPWFRGKGLGGSSAINFMVWTKPPKDDLNDIEKLGNVGWNWESFQKYLTRTEGFVPPSADTQRVNNMNAEMWKFGSDGPLKIAFPAQIDPGEIKVHQTFINAGIPIAPDPFGGNPKGVFYTPNTYDSATHTRSYAATAFYLPSADRPNLTVVVSARVYSIITKDTAQGQLTGVGIQFEVAGQIYTANADREVILSTGALISPHILELSGIGDKDVLRKIGVPVQLELPGVGENVQEHIAGAVNFELRDDVPYETLDTLRDPAVMEKHLELHAAGSGLFTSGVVNFIFASLDQLTPDADAIVRRAKEHVESISGSLPPGLLEQYRIQLDRLTHGSPGYEYHNFPALSLCPSPAEDGKRYLTIVVCMNHTFSRGSIHSTSSDPAQDPEFDPRYFEQDVDLDIWTAMLSFARKLGRTAPLKDMIAREVSPGPEVDEAHLRAWAREHVNTTWHTVGSCSMLPQEKGGVVDPQLKVYGTTNIRVVDLSVIPLHFGAHSQSIAYAVAEQAADMIRASTRT